jgi:hypothetical protein
VLASTVLGCAPRQHDVAAPSSADHDPTVERLQQQLTELERRVDALEHERPAAASESPSPRAFGWSCNAKCGTRSTQTTEFRVSYERVTGQGDTAAAAYDDMLRRCDGTIYERLEDERFVGGEMKNVCLREGSDAAP